MLNEEDIYLTEEGAGKLRRELEQLAGPRRTAMAERLRHAVQQGDLTENADYIVAKEEQAFLEGRILELEQVLRTAIIMAKPAPGEAAGLGSTIVVRSGIGEEETYQLVGALEADPRSGKVSYKSPIGNALMGSQVGDTVEAQIPAGSVKLHVLEVR